MVPKIKQLSLFLLILIASESLWGQPKTISIVVLHDGTELKGKIVRLIPNKYVVIDVGSPDPLRLSMAEVKVIKKETIIMSSTKDVSGNDFSPYGSNPFAFGITVNGGGIGGINLQYYFSPGFSVETGVSARPYFYSFAAFPELEYPVTAALSAGMTIHVNQKYKASKEKVRFHGIGVRGMFAPNRYSHEVAVSVPWVWRTFKKGKINSSFQVELGPGVLVVNEIYYWGTFATPTIYSRLVWSFHVGKKNQ